MRFCFPGWSVAPTSQSIQGVPRRNRVFAPAPRRKGAKGFRQIFFFFSPIFFPSCPPGGFPQGRFWPDRDLPGPRPNPAAGNGKMDPAPLPPPREHPGLNPGGFPHHRGKKSWERAAPPPEPVSPPAGWSPGPPKKSDLRSLAPPQAGPPWPRAPAHTDDGREKGGASFPAVLGRKASRPVFQPGPHPPPSPGPFEKNGRPCETPLVFWGGAPRGPGFFFGGSIFRGGGFGRKIRTC